MTKFMVMIGKYRGPEAPRFLSGAGYSEGDWGNADAA